MRQVTHDEYSKHWEQLTSKKCFLFIGKDDYRADLSGNIFYSTDNELKPLNICIKELAQVAEIGGGE